MLPLLFGDVPVIKSNGSGLIEDFDYQPDTSQVDGIARFVMWHKNFYTV